MTQSVTNDDNEFENEESKSWSSSDDSKDQTHLLLPIKQKSPNTKVWQCSTCGHINSLDKNA